MGDTAWQLENSVTVSAPMPFAWAYMANVANWNDPPASFELDGPFATGARGLTRFPGQEPRPWRLASVQPQESYVIETSLEGASMSFTWRFESHAEGGARLTQQIRLEGPNAAAHRSQVEAAFAPNLAAGMARIAAAIEQAAAG
jgi:hypothetical protein